MLQDTGERIILEKMKPTNGMLLEHLARYYFALPYAKGKVLDIACGTGYGAKMVAKAKKKEITSILGVDIDEKTINYAVQHYNHPLLTFKQGDVLDNQLKDNIGTFDTILSFETIEHVPDDKIFLEKICKLLTPGGKLILSSPFGQGRGKPCSSPFHYHQLTQEEFISLFYELSCPFEQVEFYFQQGVAIEKHQRLDVHYPLGIAVCTKT